MIEVWGRRSSINVQKVMWTIGELGLGFDRHTVGGSFGGNRTREFLALNPNGLVPVIRDGEIVMFESNAIVRYLSARYGERRLRPFSPRALAAAEQWMEWQQGAIAPLVSTIFMNKVRKPAADCDHQAVNAAVSKLPDALAIADKALADRPWFAGDEFSFGDIVLGCFMWRYSDLDVQEPAFANISRWFDSLKTRPAYREWVMVPVGSNVSEWSRNERELA
ncbi:MAG: glutathione S-transferase family protein [Hyphomicrobiales bacterium]